MKETPYLPLGLLLIAYFILSWILSFYNAVWLAWLFAVVAPIAGALAWSLAEDESVPAAGLMLLAFTGILALLLILAGTWPLAIVLAVMLGAVFVLPVDSIVYAILTHAIAIIIALYSSIPGVLGTILLPIAIAIPASIAWAWARIEMPISKFTRKEAFLSLSVSAWMGLAIGLVLETLIRLTSA
jgi:hypothetical protein